MLSLQSLVLWAHPTPHTTKFDFVALYKLFNVIWGLPSSNTNFLNIPLPFHREKIITHVQIIVILYNLRLDTSDLTPLYYRITMQQYSLYVTGCLFAHINIAYCSSSYEALHSMQCFTYRFNIQYYCCSWAYATWFSGLPWQDLHLQVCISFLGTLYRIRSFDRTLSFPTLRTQFSHTCVWEKDLTGIRC